MNISVQLLAPPLFRPLPSHRIKKTAIIFTIFRHMVLTAQLFVFSCHNVAQFCVTLLPNGLSCEITENPCNL